MLRSPGLRPVPVEGEHHNTAWNPFQIKNQKTIELDSLDFEYKVEPEDEVYVYQPKGSLLSRTWHYVCPLALASYIFMQCLISTQTSACTKVQPFAPWTYQVAIAFVSVYAIGFIFFVSSAFFINSWAELELQHLRGIYVGAATVIAVAGAATGLYLTDVGNYACIDSLGVYSPNVQWAEWLSMAPLLSYLTISVENKPDNLSFDDIFVILSLFLSILTGFFMNITQDLVGGWAMFVVSCIFMMGNLRKIHYSFGGKVKADDVPVPMWEQERAMMKSKLASWLCLGYPWFVFCYLLSYYDIISKNQLLVSYMICGFGLKFVFISIICLESSMLQMAAERRLAFSRRQFLRYIFHEVRVPLNTLTMGISVLMNDYGRDKTRDMKVMSMMEGSAESMTGALNEVLSMSNVEDGAMRLELRLISIRALVLASMKVVQEQAERKGVIVLVEGLAGIASRPDIITEETAREDAKYMIRGDSMRLEHVLVHFLSNAIQNTSLTTKASREDRPVVRIKVTLNVPENDGSIAPPQSMRDLHVEHSVHALARSEGVRLLGSPDRAVGVVDGLGGNDSDKTEQAVEPLRSGPSITVVVIYTNNNKDRRRDTDEELGLVVSSQIIRLHGGDMVVKSRPKQQFHCAGFNLPIATKMNTLVKFTPRDAHSDRILGFNRGATPNSGFTVSRAQSGVEAIEAGDNRRNDDDDDEEEGDENRGMKHDDPQRAAWMNGKQNQLRQVETFSGDLRTSQSRTSEAVRYPTIANLPSSSSPHLNNQSLMPAAGEHLV